MAPQKYIKQMVDTYKIMFRDLPSKRGYKSPLYFNDHPEINTFKLLNPDGVQKYQLIIGQCQWLCHLDVWTSPLWEQLRAMCSGVGTLHP